MKLLKGYNYFLKVDLIPKVNGPYGVDKDIYYHHITFKDANGALYKGQYATKEKVQKAFVVGEHVRFYVSGFEGGDEMVSPVPGTQDQEIEPRTEVPVQVYPPNGKPITGTTYSLAMAHAVNLWSGIMGPVGEDAWANHKDVLFIMADDIDQWLLKKQSEKENIL